MNARKSPGPVDRAPFQFGLASLLLFTSWVAVAASLVRTFGLSMVPCVVGMFGAWIGFHLTVVAERERLFDVVVSYLLGCVVGVALYNWIGDNLIADNARWESFESEAEARYEFLLSMLKFTVPSGVPKSGAYAAASALAIMVPITLVAAWQLHKARQRDD